jgi:hypothetical protein
MTIAQSTPLYTNYMTQVIYVILHIVYVQCCDLSSSVNLTIYILHLAVEEHSLRNHFCVHIHKIKAAMKVLNQGPMQCMTN